MRRSGYMGPCIEVQLFGVHPGNLCEVRGVHKEVHRAAFQGMHEQSVELYYFQTYTAIQKYMADFNQDVSQQAARNICYYEA